MPPLRPLPRSFYRRDAEELAPDLLGRYLVRRIDGRRLVLRLTEVEAYLGLDDPASHAYRGETPRNRAMFGDGGHAYVYFVYGMHFCMNVVGATKGRPHAVLLRAGEAVEGEAEMVGRRGLTKRWRPRDLAGGPGKLCRALAIDRELDGRSLLRGELVLTEGQPPRPDEIARGRRVGVDYAGEAAAWPLRFGIDGHPTLSKPF